MNAFETQSRALVAVSAGASDPSSTKLLADRLLARAVALAEQRGVTVNVRTFELRGLARETASALVSGHLGPGLVEAVEALAEADGVIAATPVYKAGASGLFKSFFDVIDDDLLIAKPVALAATAGTARHALVVDEHLRALFAYLRAMTVPTSLFAAPDDWNDPALGQRIDRAALELVLLIESGFAKTVREESWGSYRHELGSAAEADETIALDSEMMRLATGGSAE